MKRLLTGLDILRQSALRLVADNCLIYAAAVSYAFFLCFIPFIVLAIILSAVTVQVLFPDASSDIAQALVQYLSRIVPEASKEVVRDVIFRSSLRNSFTIANIILLPIFSGMIFRSLEYSYRRIFHMPLRRHLWRQAVFPAFGIVIVLFFLMSYFLIGILRGIGTAIIAHVKTIEHISVRLSEWVSAPFTNLISVLVLSVFFLLSVKMFLNLRIAIRDQLIAAAVFCVTWLVARWVFSIYIRYIARIDLLYGSISSLVILLIWIFYSAVVLLFAVELMYTLHVRKHPEIAAGIPSEEK
jgi:membrane protein